MQLPHYKLQTAPDSCNMTGGHDSQRSHSLWTLFVCLLLCPLCLLVLANDDESVYSKLPLSNNTLPKYYDLHLIINNQNTVRGTVVMQLDVIQPKTRFITMHSTHDVYIHTVKLETGSEQMQVPILVAHAHNYKHDLFTIKLGKNQKDLLVGGWYRLEIDFDVIINARSGAIHSIFDDIDRYDRYARK